jgi:hypothetical protein
MIRRALTSALAANGLPATPAPVFGSIRMIEPLRPAGSPVVRMSWERSAPPSAVGGVRAVPVPVGGSPQGFAGVTTGFVVPPRCP